MVKFPQDLSPLEEIRERQLINSYQPIHSKWLIDLQLDRCSPIGRRCSSIGRRCSPIGRRCSPIGRQLFSNWTTIVWQPWLATLKLNFQQENHATLLSLIRIWKVSKMATLIWQLWNANWKWKITQPIYTRYMFGNPTWKLWSAIRNICLATLLGNSETQPKRRKINKPPVTRKKKPVIQKNLVTQGITINFCLYIFWAQLWNCD